MQTRRSLSALFVVVLVTVLVMMVADAARAADRHNVTLDQAATSAAGHTTYVFCEDSWNEWLAAGGGEDNGFTRIGVPWVYVSPRQCETLYALLNREDVGTYYASSALLTLAHESVHQRGISDEGVTDCTALPLVPSLAVDFFGVPATITAYYVVTVYKRVHGHRVKTQVVKARQVANPWLTQLAADALRWHHAKPPAYQGTC